MAKILSNKQRSVAFMVMVVLAPFARLISWSVPRSVKTGEADATTAIKKKISRFHQKAASESCATYDQQLANIERDTHFRQSVDGAGNVLSYKLTPANLLVTTGAFSHNLSFAALQECDSDGGGDSDSQFDQEDGFTDDDDDLD